MAKSTAVPFPVRGVPGGWRDIWDDPDDAPLLRLRALTAEERLEREARRLRDQGEKEQAAVEAANPNTHCDLGQPRLRETVGPHDSQ